MGPSPTTTTNQTQTSQTNPYAPAQPMLQSILNTLGNQPTTPTGAQTNAANLLQTEAAGTPSFAPQGTAAVNSFFNSSTTPQQNTLNAAYGTVAPGLTPIANGSMTNPMTNPAIASLIQTTNQDTTNAINDQFAAAGRDLSPANTTALARGLSQGESGILTNQYNTNVGNQLAAGNQLVGAAGSTASGVTAQQEAQLGNAAQGIAAAGAIPGLQTAPGTTQLGAATTSAMLPYSTLQALEGLTVPIAGLGSSSTGTSNGTVTQQTPWYTTAMGAGLMGASLFSDARLKDNKRKIGMLFDGQPIFAFNYKGDATPRVGLIAQEVEKVRPDAVTHDARGIKMVDYAKATEHSRHIAGMLG